MSRGGRPINESLATARLMGERTYEGKPHACGATERYTSTGACVRCARIKTAARNEEIRLALEQARSGVVNDVDASLLGLDPEA